MSAYEAHRPFRFSVSLVNKRNFLRGFTCGFRFLLLDISPPLRGGLLSGFRTWCGVLGLESDLLIPVRFILDPMAMQVFILSPAKSLLFMDQLVYFAEIGCDLAFH